MAPCPQRSSAHVRRFRFVGFTALIGIAGLMMGQGCPSPSPDDGGSTPPPAATPCGLLGPSCPGASGDLPYAVITIDLEGDGDLDLAVANSGNGTVSLLKNNGAGAFTRSNLSVGAEPAGLATADFDRDGRPDLAVTSTLATFGPAISVLRNKGGGTFDPLRSAPLASTASAAVAVDLNGDFYPDLATAHPPTGSASVLLNVGSLQFTSPFNLLTGNGAEAIAAADLDGDGDVDLAVVNSELGTVSILRNTGNGAFLGAISFSAGVRPRSVAAADFDGDGRIDLAIADERVFNDSSADVVLILRNNGNATFTNAGTLLVGVNPAFVTAADLNGDGRPDLAVANYGVDAQTSSVVVLLNNGTSFAPPTAYQVGRGPVSIAAGDLDGNGTVDLAVANYSSDSISLLSNNGPGTFTPSR